MNPFVTIVHDPLVVFWSGYSTYSPIDKPETIMKRSTMLMNCQCIVVKMVCRKERLIPTLKAMLVGVVDNVNYFVENKSQLCWVSTKSTSHIYVPTRVCQSFQKNTQAFHTITHRTLFTNYSLRNLEISDQQGQIIFIKT